MTTARKNPTYYGIDVERVIAGVGGASVTQFVDAQWLQPTIGKVIPTGGQSAQGRLIDGALTLAAAKVMGYGLNMLGLGRYAAAAEEGGYILGGAKLISTALPSVTVSATYPSVLNRLGLAGTPSASPSASAMGGGTALGALATGQTGGSALSTMANGNTSTSVALPASAALAGSVSNYAQPANVADDAGI